MGGRYIVVFTNLKTKYHNFIYFFSIWNITNTENAFPAYLSDFINFYVSIQIKLLEVDGQFKKWPVTSLGKNEQNYRKNATELVSQQFYVNSYRKLVNIFFHITVRMTPARIAAPARRTHI